MYVPAVHVQVFVPRFVWLPPAGRSGPQPFVQSGEVPVVQVVTLSVTPPSTATVQDAAAPELLPPESVPELVPPESVPPELVPPEVEPPELLPPEVPPLEEVEVPELEAAPLESSPPLDPPSSVLTVDGLLLAAQPAAALPARRATLAQIVTIEAAFIVVSS